MISAFNKSLLVGLTISALASPAFSSTIDATVQFWSYDASPTFSTNTLANESNPIIGTTPTATFTYSGDLNWDSQTTNTVGAFIGANVGGISNFQSALFGSGSAGVTNFLNAPLSVSGDSQATFWRFTGFVSTTGASGSITHDDGATLIVGGDTLVNSPGETVSDTSNFVAGSYTNAAFVLDYVEGNGVPAILNFNLNEGVTTFASPVPEPSTWAMMIAGFFGLGFMAYRRKNQGLAFRVA